MKTPLTISDLEKLPIWVAWRQVRRGDKLTKIPFSPITREAAKANDPTTWGTRAQAEKRAARIVDKDGGGIGIMFGDLGNGLSLGGIDFDTCVQNDRICGQNDCILSQWAQDVLQRFGTYAEISPSGTGVKAFFIYRTDELLHLRPLMGNHWGKAWKQAGNGNHPPAIELYLGNRFFTLTENGLPEFGTAFTLQPLGTLEWLITTAGPAMTRDSEQPDKSRRSAKAKDNSRSAKACSIGMRVVRDGGNFEEMKRALAADPITAAWMAEKGESQGERELHRIYDKARAEPPLIRIIAGKLYDVANQAEAALISEGAEIFQRGHALVRPVSIEAKAAHGKTTIAVTLQPMSRANMLDEMSACARWEKFDKRSKDWVATDPPEKVADILLARAGKWRFRTISGVIAAPTLRPDGSLLTSEGYDEQTRLFLISDPALTMPSMPNTPTKDDALQALALLRDLLREFPFVDEVSRSVALSALISPVVRAALPVVPLHAFRASTPGTGKSYLVDIASCIATGQHCAVSSMGKDETEAEKRLDGLLLSGTPLASLDNVNGELGGTKICQAIERPSVQVRPLGSSGLVNVENNLTLLATGNGLRVKADMVRRTLVSDLDAGMERPELRVFASDPMRQVLADRGRYVRACLVIVAVYIELGLPNRLPTIGSFTEWSNYVRSALVWLGCADPAKSMERAREEDPELEELGEFIAAWREEHGSDKRLTVHELIPKCAPQGSPWSESLLRIAANPDGRTISSRRLGIWLAHHNRRIVDGWRIVSRGKAQGGVCRWQIEAVGGLGGSGGSGGSIPDRI